MTFWDTTTFAGLDGSPYVFYGYTTYAPNAFTNPSDTADGYSVARGMSSGTQNIRFDMWQRAGSLGGPGINVTLNNTNEQTELFVPFVWWNAGGILFYNAGSSPNFTNRQARVPLVSRYDGQNFNAPIGVAGGIANLRFYIATQRGGSTNPMTATIKRFKAEYNRF